MIQRVFFVIGLIVLLIVGVVFGQDLVVLLSDAGRIREAILSLGAWAPLGLIALSAIQIVFAPIPGYLVQVVGGYLFGPWLGGVYGVIGMLIGAATAFLLTRHFGVPLLERLVPARLLQGWLQLRAVNSMAGWFLVLLLPIGDFCYFLAGLSSLSLVRMLLGTLLIRGPTVFVASFVGSQVTAVPGDVWPVLVLGVIVVTVILLWQKDRLETLVFDKLLVRILSKRGDQRDQ